MTCPPCNHDCNQGRDCPNKPKPNGTVILVLIGTAYTVAVFAAYTIYYMTH